MSEPASPAPVTPPASRSIWRNWLSLAGAIIGGGSLFAFILLLVIDQFGPGKHNPYVGILSYLVAPGFMALGLLLVFGGAWMQRRSFTHTKDASPPRFSIDLSRPRDRRVLILFGLGTIAFTLLTAVGSYQTYHYTESVQFCGETCHTVMKPEFTTYQLGNHARVACVECHIGSGATFYVKSKISGAYQVYSVLFGKYSRPIPTPVANLRPAQETCEKCHWPEKFVGSLDRTYTHFLSDDANTPFTVRLLLHVGGGTSAHGPVGGIHWHMNVANKVEYYATDPQRQVIPWVRITPKDGVATVYRTPDFKGDPDPAKIRRMDCLDCHNRPAHNYRTPNDSVDEALYLGRIDKNLPGVKRVAVDLLTKDYASDKEAAAALAAGLRKQYAGQPGLDPAIAEVVSIYQHNFFPDMKADWSKYPDNIGHKNSNGCFRCHDGKHQADGSTRQITATDCNTCHTLISQGKDESLATFSGKGLKFDHPGGDPPDGLLCSDCHNGKNQSP